MSEGRVKSKRKKKKTTQSVLITKRVQETKDTVTLRLDVKLDYEPGQFIMVQAIIDGESVRRAYSVSSSPTRDYLEITVRQTDEPTMSKYLNEVQEGDYLEIRGPYGRFIWTEEVTEKAVFLGAGSGITPFRCFLQYLKDKELDNPVKLLYSCSYGDNVIFKDYLPRLTEEVNCKYELSLTREPEGIYPGTRKGRIDKEYLQEEIKGFEKANYYICGAPGFVGAMMDTLKELGIPDDQVHREQWG